MCTLGVQGIRVVFDTFSCSRTCTSWAHGCACVSADVTLLDLAHMFDATQEHRLREMLTFLQYMCTLGVLGIRVVFDTFSCSRTCTSWAHGCACVSADVTRLDLAHMFDATQEHRLREMLTFLQYAHTRSPRN